MAKRIKALALGAPAAVVAVLAVSQVGANASKGAARVGSKLPAAVMNLATSKVAAAGDPRPELIEHAIGTRAEANAVAAGDVVPGTRPSYLIAIRGQFTVPNVAPPLGPWAPASAANAPPTETYRVMTLVVDAQTRQVTDFGLANSLPDLSRMGNVVVDHPRRLRTTNDAR